MCSSDLARRKGVSVDDKIYATHGSYPVCGFSFAPLYNITYKFRAGLSLDGVYDGSANMYAEEQPVALGDESVYYEFLKPDASKRFALGMSARAEYVMPFFSIGFGMGYNLFYSSGDTKGFYQTLALKVNLTRSAYLNIGYNLQNFSTPNYLMLGIGYRFHNRYPRMKWL